MTEEISIWQDSPSQWLNLGPFAAALLVAAILIAVGVYYPPALLFTSIALVIPAIYMIWKYLQVRTQVFELTSERLRITRGVINQKIEEIELYRVKDYQMTRVWWMRLTGLSSIILTTSDRSTAELVIPAVHGGGELREQLRKQVELLRDRKRVRETDFDESGGAALHHG